MAFSKLSDDEQLIICYELRDPLHPVIAINFFSASKEVWVLTNEPRRQLKADNKVAALFARNHLTPLQLSSIPRFENDQGFCAFLRTTTLISIWTNDHQYKRIDTEDLALLGKLGSFLPCLERLYVSAPGTGLDSITQFAEKLSAGALPAMTSLDISHTPMQDEGALALAAAVGRGAMPRLSRLHLDTTGIGVAGLKDLAPVVQHLPDLKDLALRGIPGSGDERFAAIMALLASQDGEQGIEQLDLRYTNITTAEFHTLVTAATEGTLPRLQTIYTSIGSWIRA